MNRLIQVRKATPLCLVALACFGLLPATKALLPPPPPDGGYPGVNTAEGTGALFNRTTGINNTATGNGALFMDTTGSFNTAIGVSALRENNGNSNTAAGHNALRQNQTGVENTATGGAALRENDVGSENTAVGFHALLQLKAGPFSSPMFNTAIGAQALERNQQQNNTAVGYQALQNDIFGDRCTAVGAGALKGNSQGIACTAVGAGALNSSLAGGNTALGVGAGSNVIAASNVICIGTAGADVDGGCFIGNIRDVTTEMADAIPVVIDSEGQLGTLSSSQRFKNEIKPMDKTSEAILAFKPVTFHYKSDNTNTPQFGLIAEEVEKVNRDLVVRDREGKPYTVRYDAVNAMLLNEFLKEHKKTEKLEATVASLIATVKEQAAQIQKVSAQLETSKPGPQVVNNP
jgi:hypothetical protein